MLWQWWDSYPYHQYHVFRALTNWANSPPPAPSLCPHNTYTYKYNLVISIQPIQLHNNWLLKVAFHTIDIDEWKHNIQAYILSWFVASTRVITFKLSPKLLLYTSHKQNQYSITTFLSSIFFLVIYVHKYHHHPIVIRTNMTITRWSVFFSF